MDRIAAEDVEIRGIKVNKGTAVTAAIYVMHRSEDYFENPDDFQPERLNLYNECAKTSRPKVNKALLTF